MEFRPTEPIPGTFTLEKIIEEPEIIEATGDLLDLSLVQRGLISQEQKSVYLEVLACNSLDLREKAEYIRGHVIDANNPDSVYSRVYNSYTKTTRVKQRVELIIPALEGSDVLLDIGTGNGNISVDIANEHNKLVIATDVHDYRSNEAKNNPNIKFLESNLIDLEGEFAEGAFCSLVLHHVEDREVNGLLRSIYAALKPGSNFVILEETPPPKANEAQDLSDTKLDSIFREIDEVQAKKLLGVMDYISNWIGNGVYEVPLPIEFHTINEWTDKFSNLGFSIKSIDYFGIPPLEEKFTPVPGTRFVVQK